MRLVSLIEDRKFRLPRKWSNQELQKFAPLFRGKVINVSAWKDQDKEGRRYKDYFENASEYCISNYYSEFRGFQGNLEKEIFLDLTIPIPKELENQFDVVFNHTTLEHIFDVFTAFQNLCRLTKDILIIVVPFLQEQHEDFGDYWRFTPLTLKKLMQQNNLEMIYINYNDTGNTSIYLFAIGSKNPEKWEKIRQDPNNKLAFINNHKLGQKTIKNSLIFQLIKCLKSPKNLWKRKT
ncbi:class I SAM-dependent methyltransferase [Thermosulfurimonas sp. F29]|uniref:class I SAM-dependent methyltransferase n=1 Tax=Thermosulfurimonas sp. F29 TaxID=2867247 RepID=UPI001C834242|nr:class I SAM-dependent methyltransferase [Thermosulfurimonas sp. F29]MBX6422820.1 class I SAM-dependent methyltransferase [Thermosulfurimonas sp. F29]